VILPITTDDRKETMNRILAIAAVSAVAVITGCGSSSASSTAHKPAPAASFSVKAAKTPVKVSTAMVSKPSAAPNTGAVTASPLACHPKTSDGKCYEAGQVCLTADHDMAGVAGNGIVIACKNEAKNSWRWETV
jgi:hypothetical protein